VNIIIFDCEIKRGIPARGEEKIPGIKYCRGWGDHAGMGVSVTGAYSYDDDRYRVFCDDNVDEMLELFDAADLLVGFNNIRFDDPLLTATYEDFDSVTTERYDLLVEIWRAAGLKPSWGSPKTHGGFGLDAMCEANYGVRKTGHGAMAPVDWQRGNIGKVIDYCLNDIRMTKMLMDAAIMGDEVISPKGGTLRLREPVPTFVIEEQVNAAPEPDVVFKDRVDVEALQREQAKKTFPIEPYVEGTELKWEDLLIEVENKTAEDRVMVAVHTNTGLLISRVLMLHEWSNQDLNDAFNNEDAAALVKYLSEHEKLYRGLGDDSGDVK